MLAACGLTFAGGVASHVVYFNRGEHHLHGARYLLTFVALYTGWIYAAVAYSGDTLQCAAVRVSAVAACYLAGLFASLVLYRTLLSPLCRFPGPVLARVSDFGFSTQLGRLDLFRVLQRFHAAHGDFVRVGSNTLSIRHPGAVEAVHGARSACRKADFYDLTRPMTSMHTARDRGAHDRRRREWSPAFGDKALRGYEERMRAYQDRLVAKLREAGGQPVEVMKWFALFSFDVLGDLAFGASFGMLEARELHWAVRLLRAGLRPHGLMMPTWFLRMMMMFPGLTRDYWRFVGFCRAQLEERIRTTPEVPDIMSALLQPYAKAGPTADDMQMLYGESQLIVVAGSDTTATTLTTVMYELGRHPEHIARLRAELAPHGGPDGSPPTNHELQNLPHLNAVIHEALRLHPPVPSALQRLTPPEGLEIDGTFVPGNTCVWTPQWAMGRNEAAYADADAFVPERWTTRPELVKERGAYAPFSAGPYGCIGRPLALLSLRTTLARLLLEFDVAFAPGETGAGIETGTVEHFTLAPGPLWMVFRKREG